MSILSASDAVRNRAALLVRSALLAVAIAGVAAPALAKEVTVTVPAKAGPWSPALNPKLKYGVGDALPPVSVPVVDGDEIGILPEGTIKIGTKTFGGSGDESNAVDDKKGKKGKLYPSFYTPKVLYPANLHGLVGTFADERGVIVGRPFMIGEGIKLVVPDAAKTLLLGFNDESYKDNEGEMKVTLFIPD
jgi:hypothetical protein